MSLDKHYQYVESKLDIDNFIQYYMSNIYFVNTDWPGNNIVIGGKELRVLSPMLPMVMTEDGVMPYMIQILDSASEMV